MSWWVVCGGDHDCSAGLLTNGFGPLQGSAAVGIEAVGEVGLCPGSDQ